ncbi:DNA repair protein RecO [Halobacteriovorax sp. HLS]|uniref:DNA repair protein RecO n=1 Tax=Halobacteriovorax sp. HLS TaxID=2234000 RepID=UPI0013E2F25C|nr:recombination protein O N-terminal domain-containing protein [Halobacteriovorax sp. HLS]
MQTKVEGIVLSKTPFQDRHLVCRLLLRNGEKISAIFYGGQGGGSKKKSSFLEVGHLIKVEITRAKTTAQIFSIKEWSLSWNHNQIRKNHKAFYMLCFFLELADKLVVEADLFNGQYDEGVNEENIFKVLSNGIFYLEKNASTKDEFYTDLFVYISKILIQEGIFPERNHCVLSGEELISIERMSLLDEQGGFADSSCVNQESLDVRINPESTRELWNILCVVALTKYGEMEKVGEVPKSFAVRLIDYLFYQISVEKNEFKSMSLVI